MSATPTKPDSIIVKIQQALTPDEIKELLSQAVGYYPQNDLTLRRINRAAVIRNKQLSRV